MRIFIDTNIYLNFIRPSSENLQSLEKLRELLDKKDLELIFPTIIQEEFLRDYPRVAAGYLKTLGEQLPKKPAIAAVHKQKSKGKRTKIKEKYDAYIKELENIIKIHPEAVRRLVTTVEELIRRAIQTPETQEIIEAGSKRRLRGNPPGKASDPLGDQLVWETILSHCSDDDLTVISVDGDWKNSLEPKRLNPLLEKEWTKKSTHKAECRDSLGSFINDFVEEEVIPPEEIEKEKIAAQQVLGQTENYISSPSLYVTGFPSTHTAFDLSNTTSPVWTSPPELWTKRPTLADQLYLDEGRVFPAWTQDLYPWSTCPQCGNQLIRTATKDYCEKCHWDSTDPKSLGNP